jgi:hypothetical protein
MLALSAAKKYENIGDGISPRQMIIIPHEAADPGMMSHRKFIGKEKSSYG